MTEQMSIGKQIVNIRKEHNLTQEEFGKLFYVTRQTVSNWENENIYLLKFAFIKIIYIFASIPKGRHIEM